MLLLVCGFVLFFQVSPMARKYLYSIMPVLAVAEIQCCTSASDVFFFYYYYFYYSLIYGPINSRNIIVELRVMSVEHFDVC